jgi:ketosteroid isomerase-like protein
VRILNSLDDDTRRSDRRLADAEPLEWRSMLSASSQEERPMSVRTSIADLEANRRLVGRHFDFLNEGDRSIAEATLSPSVVFFGPRAPEGIHGREALIDFHSSVRRDAPTSISPRANWWPKGTSSATRYTSRRTHRTEEATTKVIAAEGMQLLRIGDGVIQEITRTSTD